LKALRIEQQANPIEAFSFFQNKLPDLRANPPEPRLLEIARQCKFRALISSRDLDHILFTSGSRGIPKGVMLSPKGLEYDYVVIV